MSADPEQLNYSQVNNPFGALDEQFDPENYFRVKAKLNKEKERKGRFKPGMPGYTPNFTLESSQVGDNLEKVRKPYKAPMTQPNDYELRFQEKERRRALGSLKKKGDLSSVKPASKVVFKQPDASVNYLGRSAEVVEDPSVVKGISRPFDPNVEPFDVPLNDNREFPPIKFERQKPDFESNIRAVMVEGEVSFQQIGEVRQAVTQKSKQHFRNLRKIAEHKSAQPVTRTQLAREASERDAELKAKITREAAEISSNLVGSLLKTKGERSPFQPVVPNASYLLANYNMGKAHPKVVEQLKSRPKGFMQDMRFKAPVVGKIELGVFHPALGLPWKNRVVNSRATLEECKRGLRDPKHRDELERIYTQWEQAMRAKRPKEDLLEMIATAFNKVSVKSKMLTQKPFRPKLERASDDGSFVRSMQGNTSSAPVSMTTPLRVDLGGVTTSVSVQNPLVDMGMDDLLTLLGGESYITKVIVNIVCLATSICECHSTLNVLAQCISFINNTFEGGVAVMFIKMVRSRFAATHVRLQGKEELPQDPLGVEMPMKNVLFSSLGTGGELAQALWSVLSVLSVSAMTLALGFRGDVQTAMKLKDKLDKLITHRDGVETLIQRLFRLVKLFCEKVKTSFERRDFSAFFEGFSMSDWLATATVVVEDVCVRADAARLGIQNTFAKNLADGKYPPRIFAQMTNLQRAELIDVLLEEYSGHAKALVGSADISMARTLDNMRDRLVAEKYSISNSKASGEYRVEPFALFIHGIPGSGKSSFCTQFQKILGRKRCLPLGADGVYVYTRSSNFFDGVTGAQWIVLMDDIDKSVGNISNTEITHPELIVQLVNTKPFQLEQADVNSKGKMYCNYQAVVYCTNYKLARLQNFCVDTLAFWRRFSHTVEFIVKPEFATAKGLLDKSKIDGSNDYWNFEVGVFDDTLWDASNQFTSFPFSMFQLRSVSELAAFVSSAFDMKMKHQLAILEKSLSDDGPFCPHCMLTEKFHSKEKCVEVQGSISEDPWFLLLVACGLWYGLGFWFVIAGLFFFALKTIGSALGITMRDFGVAFRHELKIMWLTRTQSLRSTAFRYLDSRTMMSVAQFREREGLWAAAITQKVSENKNLLMAVAAASVGVTALASIIAYKVSQHRPEVQGYVVDATPIPDNSVKPTKGVWTRVVPADRDPLAKGALSTSTIAQVIDAASSRFVHALNLETNVSLLGVQISGNVVMIPGHLLFEKMAHNGMEITRLTPHAPCRVCFRKGTLSYTMEVNIGINAIQLKGREAVLVRVIGLPICVSSSFDVHLPFTTQSAVRPCFDETWFISLRDGVKNVQRCSDGRVVRPNGGGAAYIEVRGVQTQVGDCGGLYVARVGSFVFIAGYHVLAFTFPLDSSKNFVAAEELTELELKAGFQDLVDIGATPIPNGVLGILQCNSHNSDRNYEVRLKDLPLKSSVGVAITRGLEHVTVLGTMDPPFPLSTLRSGCDATLVAEHFRKRELDICGETPYFTKPVFKGTLQEDGQWIDPYVTHLMKMKNKHADERFWCMAVADYCHGMEKLAGWDGVRPLTDYEAWMGVENSDIGSINLKTSAGPPFFQRKENFVKFDHINKTVDVQQIVLEQIQEIYDVIDMGLVYIPMASHSLKDEPISNKKVLEWMIRNFSCFPMGFNFLLKKYFTGFCMMIRAHREFFESMVSANFFSMDVDEFVRDLIKVARDRLGDGDFTHFDGTQGSQLRHAEGEVWRRMSECAGFNPVDKQRVYMLFLGTVYTMRFIKNDLILLAFQNPSGGWITLDTNGVSNSLCFRYCYYAEWFSFVENVVVPVLFRIWITLRTLGDDNIYSVHPRCVFFTHEVLVRRMFEIGMGYTTADKALAGKIVPFKTIEEVSFLKRRFRKVGERWQARLELKSLVKMAVMAKKSELGRKDHAAVLMSNINRELFYHGREIFDDWMFDINTAVMEFDLHESRYCRMFTFEQLQVLFDKNAYPLSLRGTRLEVFQDDL